MSSDIVTNKDDLEEKFEKKNKKKLKTNYVCICLYAFLTGTDFAVIIPTLWDRLNDDYNATGTFMGLVLSSYSFCGVISGLIMGKLSDKIQKTKIFITISITFPIIGHVLYFFGINKYLILLARAISGLCIGASTVALALIARTTTEEKRTAILSIIMASRQLGLMFGPAFNIVLRKANFIIFGNFRVDRKSIPGLFMAISWTIYFFIFMILFKEIKSNIKSKKKDDDDLIQNSLDETNDKKNYSKSNLKQFLKIEVFILLTLTFFTYFNQTSLETMVIPFTEIMFGWKELENSILFCCGGIIIIVSFLLIRFLSKKLKDRVILLLGLSSILIGLVIACIFLPFVNKFDSILLDKSQNSTLNFTTGFSNESFLDNLDSKNETNGLFLGAFIVFVIFDVVGLPAIAITSASLFTKLIDNNVQGLGQGIQRGVLGIGTIFGPLCAGPLIFKPIILISITLAILSMIFIMIIVFFKRLKPSNLNQEYSN